MSYYSAEDYHIVIEGKGFFIIQRLLIAQFYP